MIAFDQGPKVNGGGGATEWDGGALAEEIGRLEVEIEDRLQAIERCRKIDLVSKAAIGLGGVAILAILFGLVGFHPTAMIGALAAVIGGAVAFGSNVSTWQQIAAAKKAAETRRADLIAMINPRVVSEFRSES
jgi:hypothetical protein